MGMRRGKGGATRNVPNSHITLTTAVLVPGSVGERIHSATIHACSRAPPFLSLRCCRQMPHHQLTSKGSTSTKRSDVNEPTSNAACTARAT
jgi:hypothetical protein